MSLDGRVAFVTGAGGQGMGRSIALTLARDGADIALNWRREREHAERTAEAIRAMGRRVALVRGDVSVPEDALRLVAETGAVLGPIGIVAHGAGGPWKPQDITQIEPEHLRRVLAGEIESTYYVLRAVLPVMREQGYGRFVSIGGHMADDWRFGPPDAPLDYPLGKAARHWLTRTLALMERERGITINAVAPGPTRRFTHEEAVAAVTGDYDRTKGNTPQDIAEIVAWLCSDAATRVTGAVVPVPGDEPV